MLQLIPHRQDFFRGNVHHAWHHLFDGVHHPIPANIRFLCPGTGGVEVEIEACTTELGKSSFVQAYRVTEVETGRLLGEAEALLVAWNNERRCKVPMAPTFRRRIAAFEGLDAGE